MQKIKKAKLLKSKLSQGFILQAFKSLSTGVMYCFASRGGFVTTEQFLGGLAGLPTQSGYNK